MIIGREKEIKILNNSYKSEQSSFVALYGRRRIGKTYLVNETFKDNIYFRHAGIYGGTYEEQLIAFKNSLKDCGYELDGKFNDWFEAFEALKSFIKQSNKTKKVIFIDEIAWIGAADEILDQIIM